MSAAPSDWAGIAQLTERVFDAVDWPTLADIYFHDDGEAIWRERRPRVVAQGCELGERLAAHVSSGGASLWVGAGVTELPILLGEVLLLQRTVLAANLIERECEALNAALAAVLPDAGSGEPALLYTAGNAAELAVGRSFDHLGCISVFTDPEVWPALSGVAYGRLPPVQLDLGQFEQERERARELADALFTRLQPPAWITTSAEEVAWFLERAAVHGRVTEAAEDLVETAVVGDPVGFLQVR